MNPTTLPPTTPAGQSVMPPCAEACSGSFTPPPGHSDRPPAGYTDVPPTRQLNCRLGLTRWQLTVLRYAISINGSGITTYQEIATALQTTHGITTSGPAVRGVLDRLSGHGYLRCARMRKGIIQGIRIIIKDIPCPALWSGQGLAPSVPIPHRSGDHSTLHSGTLQPPTSLDSLDRDSNLSASLRKLRRLTDKDFNFHFPNLARSGFGLDQISQIVVRRLQIESSLSHVFTGLQYAEWELEHDKMFDSKNNPVKDPCSWVFTCLSKSGSYKRPAGYISPEYQAELDWKEEQERLSKIREERFQLEFEAWNGQLSESDKLDILGKGGPLSGGPLEIPRLREHFRKHVFKNTPEGKPSPQTGQDS